IVVGIPPLPLREALVSLLNGSRFNFIMVDSEREPGKLQSVILTYRGDGGLSQPAIATPEPPLTDATTPEPDTPEQPMQQEMQARVHEGGAAASDVPPAPDNPPPQ